jgi:hypothetical protein
MQITQDHPDFTKVVVFLDNKVCFTVIAASEEEGWVDIVDIAAAAPLDLSEDEAATIDDGEPTPWQEFPVKRKYGKVEIRKTV